MFERSRSDLVTRLTVVMNTLENIARRSDEWQQKSALAARLGLGGSSPDFFEISGKAREQAGLCGQSITHLLVDRAMPWTFKSGVARVEQFARQCEAILDHSDAGEAAGKQAFSDRIGTSV